MQLLRYDAALRALAEAKKFDDVKEIRDKAVAVKAYAQQIKDIPMLKVAAEIIFRAQVKGGRILAEMAKRGERDTGKGGDRRSRSQGATVIAPPTLTELGISKSQSSRWQALADLSEKERTEREVLFVRKCISATNGTGKILRTEMKAADEARVRSLAPIKGKFKTIIVDPPWDYEWLSVAGRAKPGYATMTHDELMRLDVRQWCESSCHMYLWVTNNFMTRGVDLMAQWGFQHKTVLTWVKLTKTNKPWFGLGAYFRNSTEHVLFGVRGDLKTRAASMRIPTHFTARIGEHSEKPEEFYDIVRKASYLPAAEMFQRKERKGIVNVFQAATPMKEAAE